MELPTTNFLYLVIQTGFELPSIEFPYLGTRGLTGIVMLIHIFFATLFVGFAVGSPVLQLWSRRGDPRMARLAHSLARFNVLTFSIGATMAVMFLVVLIGFYPRVTTALFVHFFWFFPVMAMTAMLLTLWLFYVHYYTAQNRARPLNIAAGLAAAFFILVWQAILTGIDTFMVTGGAAGDPAVTDGTGISSIGSALYSLYTPTVLWQNLHRIFGNLSWPAFAVAAWAALMYRQVKSEEDKSYFDWVGSTAVIWGTLFLLLQPLAGFAIAYAMKLGATGPYDRLTGAEGATFTSGLLWVNLIMVVVLFVLANAAMYMGAQRHPDLSGQRPIRFFGLVALLAGLYSISPFADFPFLYMRYIMILIMVLATVGALVAYVRGRRQFSYGSPGNGYRVLLASLGVVACVVTLSMGWMKSNSRAPYTIYGQPEYRVDSEAPITPEQFTQETPRVVGTPEFEETPKAKEG